MANLYAIKKIQGDPNVEQTFELALRDDAKKSLAYSNLSHILLNTFGVEKLEPVTVANVVVQMTNLGFSAQTGEAYAIPYGNRCTFQMGYKGWISLAMRSGKVKTINAAPIYEGEFKGENRVTGEYVFDFSQPIDNKKIIGYTGYLETTDGFKKTIYWTEEQMHQHFIKFSPTSYDPNTKKWMQSVKKKIVSTILNTQQKSQITMLKQLLSKWAPKNSSIELALQNDGKTFDETGKGTFTGVDTPEARALEMRVPVDKAILMEMFNVVGKVGKEHTDTVISSEFGNKKSASAFMNKMAKESGIDFGVSGGWYGITLDELKAFMIVVEKKFNKEILIDGVRYAEEKPEDEKEIDLDF